jgi:hypothetical protein
MQPLFRPLALALALSAILLRTLVPEGWMPSADTRAPLIICPMMGGVMHAAPAHRGLPQHHDRYCPFTASLAQLAAVSLPAIPAVPASPIAAGDVQPDRFVFVPAAYRSQSPRAPPLIA